MQQATKLKNRFAELAVPEELRQTYTTDSTQNRITGLKRLNVFIGPNNSGKSRLLRSLFGSPELLFSEASTTSYSILEAKSNFLNAYNELVSDEEQKRLTAEKLGNVFPLLRKRDGEVSPSFTPYDPGKIRAWADSHGIPLPSAPSDRSHLRSLLTALAAAVAQDHRTEKVTSLINTKFIYVPAIRGHGHPSPTRHFTVIAPSRIISLVMSEDALRNQSQTNAKCKTS